MIVNKTSVFPAPRKIVFEKLQKLETLQYIAKPFAEFESVGNVAIIPFGSLDMYTVLIRDLGGGYMKNTLKIRFLSMYFHSIMKPEYRNKSVSRKQVKNVAKEQKKITFRAGEMSDGKLISSYIMAIYFIAMNRKSGLDAEENYEILAKAISSSKILKSTMGNSDSYLDDKKLPRRLQWAEESKKRTQKNNWVVEVLPRCDEYDLGYDFTSAVSARSAGMRVV